jgi:HEAT repeat protein
MSCRPLLKPFRILLSLCIIPLAQAADKSNASTPTDFTAAHALPFKPKHDWTLGPTGARGWYHTANGHSHTARQILVTDVAAGSSSEGILQKDDVILGVNGTPFSDDARVQFANAITAAEANDGRLKVRHWRAGKVLDSTIPLAALGSYGPTAPFDCEKSKRIFEQGCASLAERMRSADYTKRLDAIPRSLNALALLASGKKEHLPLLAKEAAWAADFTTTGYLSWYYGYLMMFVSEYVLATGDTSVLPGLKRLALETANGQSGVGTWGHRFAVDHGNLGGYGAMNQPGLSLTIGMVLAREAGVRDPELDRAITKSAEFLRWWLHKGAIPYGDHLPFAAHEDNGKCAAGAVLFDLLGDREAADFFAKMTTAAYSERERGHTGNYFNHLWALLGVARCGPHAIGAYLKEQSWHYDFARGKDNVFLYQPSPEGAEEYRAYIGWDCSGSNLLAFSLPLRSLRITGKKPFNTTPLTPTEAAEVIAAGKHFPFKDDPEQYEERTTDQLLTGLKSWSPFVRKRSAAALGKRSDENIPTAVMQMLESPSTSARYGAIEALGALGLRANASANKLRAALRDSDPWMQCLAADAITHLGPDERKASVGDLLAVTTSLNPADPRRHAALAASLALFKAYPGVRAPNSILQDSLEGVDRAKLYPALQALLKHEDSIARGTAARAFKHLTDADLVEMLPHILPAIKRMAPSNEMFADGVRLAGIDLLSRLRIREGMELCVETIEPERWGERNRSGECLNYLHRYGTHAKPLLPKIRELRNYLATVKKAPAETLKRFDEHIATIESATEEPTLVDLNSFSAPTTR